ncbi:DNA ligase [Streptomyces sp. AcH 505]|uniref:ATP-dependent DNA ligase n=1 Tax=Streptomyces sp. AcH 505 TaxID=352211 RepID=UPI001F525F35
MDLPVDVALARSAPVLPAGSGWWYEPKFDGHRMIMARGSEGVRLQSRSRRIVTAAWADLATAGMQLRPGTILDGEAVIWVDGRLDFAAAQSRAASSAVRARQLAAKMPASYAVWDLLSDPVRGDVRARPYVERRQLLLDVLEGARPPIQVVPATDDRDVALIWYTTLQPAGIEGIVAKRADSAYRSNLRSWIKVRHADTTDGLVVGYVGPGARPRALVLNLPGWSGPRLSGRLDSALAARIGLVLAGADRLGTAVIHDETYTMVDVGLEVEVLVGTGRHARLTVTRMR